MTDHRPAARAAIRGMIQLLTDTNRRRQPRDFIADATRFPHRWRHGAGDCPDWLAAFLCAGAVAFTVLAFVAATVQ